MENGAVPVAYTGVIEEMKRYETGYYDDKPGAWENATKERALAPHPSLKPQAFMRQVVRASLPLGVGTVLDPFMGGGSTIAAALAVGYESIGIESDPVFYRMAEQAIPKLAELGAETVPYSPPMSEKINARVILSGAKDLGSCLLRSASGDELQGCFAALSMTDSNSFTPSDR